VRKTWYGTIVAVAAITLFVPLPSSAQRFKEGSKVGIGVEAAIPVFGKLNFRGGFNFMNYNHPFHQDGITYNGTFNLRSVEASLDWFPFGQFHVSPGALLYNGNKINATMQVPGGQSLTLNGFSYTSDPSNPLSGTGNIVVWRAAPKVTVGWGNLIPRSGRRWSVGGEIGVAYQGAPMSTIAFQGNACDSTGANCVNAATDPIVRANIAAEQAKINKNISPFRFYPIIAVGAGFNF
jgi:hypothetical protein